MEEQHENWHMRALALKWQEGTITDEEKKRFNQWYESVDELSLKEITQERPGDLQKRLYKQIARREELTAESSWFRKNPFYLTAVAAALALCCTVYGYFFFTAKPSRVGNPIAIQDKTTIFPGGNRAVLTLADGSDIVLDQVATGVLRQQGRISIRKHKDGTVSYETSEKNADNLHSGGYNTITTPRGGQYQLKLADGTRVWLNAASSLRFPVAFSGHSRAVELSGEAYFEVNPERAGGRKRARIPFLVKTKNQVIEVLGTDFNVSAYADEPETRTTLLKGAVKVTQPGKHAPVRLSPGQQAVNDQNGIEVSDVDAFQAIAWKQGYFLFDNESVESMMRKISRWYDVEVEYSGSIRYRKFGGRISKFENISEVLQVMERTKVIHFRTEGRRVVVMP